MSSFSDTCIIRIVVVLLVLTTSLWLSQICVPVRRHDNRPLPNRIPLVTLPTYPEMAGCTFDENNFDCAFDDSEELASETLRAIAAIQEVGFATAADGGVCLPQGVKPENVALRLPEGDWSLSNSVISPSQQLEVYSKSEGEILVIPANLRGATDGGHWTQQVAGLSQLLWLPRDHSQSPQMFSPNRRGFRPPPKVLVEVEPYPRVKPLKIESLRGVQRDVKLPVRIWVHGWTNIGQPDVDEIPESRAVQEIIRGLSRDDRDYVLEARQGERRAIAVIRSSSPNPVLELAPQARMLLNVVNSKGKAMKIYSVEVFEDVDGEQDCSANTYHPWYRVKPAQPSKTVEIQVPPGPWRCLAVWWTSTGNPLQSVLIPAPLRAERIQLRLVVDSDDSDYQSPSEALTK